MKLYLSILIVLIFALSTMAQVNYKEGNPRELKGLTKVFVDTEGDVESHDYIVKSLNKAKLPKVKIVDKIEESDIILDFKYDTVDLSVSSNGTATATNPGRSVGDVLIAGKNPKKLQRIVLNIGITQDLKARDKTAIEFVKAFIKIYKKANNLK